MQQIYNKVTGKTSYLGSGDIPEGYVSKLEETDWFKNKPSVEPSPQPVKPTTKGE